MRSADVPAQPAVNDRVVEPETGTEMIRGQIRKVLPAEPPHADEQCRIASVIATNVAPGYAASTELLTRVDEEADFATDACIRKLGRDPATGARHVEELSFEVKHTQSSAEITQRARQLIRRGVRRVFAIHVKEDEQGALRAGPVREWLAREDCWLELHPEAEIMDSCLVQPIRVQALIDATEADNQVARTLLAKNNPVLVQDRQDALEAQKRELDEAHARELEAHARELEAHARELEAHARELEAQGERDRQRLRKATLEICDLLAVEVRAERRALMEAMASNELDRLRSAIIMQRCWPAKF
jgi:hypothetical protein